MGIQDDIFDVEHYIESTTDDKGLQDSFERIVFYIGELEKSMEEIHRYINELEMTIKTLRKLDEKGS